jgi:hypothetical protein
MRPDINSPVASNAGGGSAQLFIVVGLGCREASTSLADGAPSEPVGAPPTPPTVSVVVVEVVSDSVDASGELDFGIGTSKFASTSLASSSSASTSSVTAFNQAGAISVDAFSARCGKRLCA